MGYRHPLGTGSQPLSPSMCEFATATLDLPEWDESSRSRHEPHWCLTRMIRPLVLCAATGYGGIQCVTQRWEVFTAMAKFHLHKNQRIELLRGLDLFSRCTKTELGRIASLTTEHRAESGEVSPPSVSLVTRPSSSSRVR